MRNLRNLRDLTGHNGRLKDLPQQLQAENPEPSLEQEKEQETGGAGGQSDASAP